MGRQRTNNSIVKVLHLIDSLDLGGAQTLMLGWLEAYDRSRFRVEIAALHGSQRSLFNDRVAKLEVPVHFLSPHKYLPLYIPLLVRLLQTRGYDVVHCHLFAANWLGKPLARLMRVPVVISHDHCNDRWRVERCWVRRTDAFCNRFADRIFAVGETVRDFLVSAEHLPPDRVEVILNGVPDRDVPVRQPATQSRRIGGAGRLVSQKNFDRFLWIARELVRLDPSYEFVIAGSGPQEQMLKATAARLALPARWLGNLPSLDDFYSEIDCFLLTSDFEGLPMVLLEALQLGIPVAATAVDGSATYFHEVALLLDPSTNPTDLAQEIHRYLADQPLVQERVALGKQLVLERFSAERQIRTIEARYLALLEGKRYARGSRKDRTLYVV
jgi:glycosyltransferase involved in cell wall biosynthesis